MGRVTRVFIASLLILVLLSATEPGKAKAVISGKTWTCIVVCGAALVYYLAKLRVDNNDADAQGRAADLIVNASWTSQLPGQPAELSTLRSVRAALINDIVGDVPADTISKYRANYESLRTCWNQFIYAGSADAGTAGSGTQKAAKGNAPDAKVASASDAPAGSGSCTDDATNVLKQFNQTADTTDLNAAFTSGPSLYQQIVNLNVGSYADYDSLRASYLFYMGKLLHFEMNPSANKAGGSLNVTDLATNCVTGLDALKCVGSLGTIETTAAANRRKTVACDVAMRAQLPMVTTLRRLKQRVKMLDVVTEDPKEGPSYNFGAAPGC